MEKLGCFLRCVFVYNMKKFFKVCLSYKYFVGVGHPFHVHLVKGAFGINSLIKRLLNKCLTYEYLRISCFHN